MSAEDANDFDPQVINFIIVSSYIVKEKELRQKELMKMMSVTESDIGWSWFATFMLVHFFTATFAAVVSLSIYENSDSLLLWIFWMLTFIALIAMSMAISSLSTKSVRGVLIGLLIFFSGYILSSVFAFDEANIGLIQLISLHPIAAFAFGLNQMGSLESAGIGLTFDSISSSENQSGYSFQNTLQVLMFDCILWGVLTWYLNRVIKPDFGQALPFYFPFSLNYWSPSKKHAPLDDTTGADKASMGGIPYEPVGDTLKRQTTEGKSIEIHNLRKKFGDKYAVDGLSLSMYSGQITALLGHNGKFNKQLGREKSKMDC